MHREDEEKPNKELNIHKYGIHCYNTTYKAVLLINTVSGNKQGFSNIQINGADQETNLYVKLGYTSVKDFRCIVKSQQIADCTVTVQYINISHKIMGTNIADAKVKTTRKKPIYAGEEIVIIIKELAKIHKYVFMTAGILFVNGIPFLFF